MHMFIRLVPLVALVACVDGDASDSGELLVGRDSTGAPVSVEVGDQRLHIQSSDREALVTWTDGAASLEHTGVTHVFATADVEGKWSVVPEQPSFVGIGPMIGTAERLVQDAGIELPWRESQRQVLGACAETSTWVWGGSCHDCYHAAKDASGLGPSWELVSSSCSSGSIYTTCSVTRCKSSEMMEMEYAY